MAHAPPPLDLNAHAGAGAPAGGSRDAESAAGVLPPRPALGPPTRTRRLRVWSARALLVVGLALMTLWARAEWERGAFQAAQSSRFDGALHARLPALAGPSSRALAHARVPLAPGVLGRIRIPRLRISAMIAEGDGPRELALAIGHVPGSAAPGEDGNCALAGHRDTFLRRLRSVRPNDVVRLETLRGTWSYRVEWATVVGARRTDVLAATPEPALTLITCYPFHFVGPAPDRFVVRARRVDDVAALEPVDGLSTPLAAVRPR